MLYAPTAIPSKVAMSTALVAPAPMAAGGGGGGIGSGNGPGVGPGYGGGIGGGVYRVGGGVSAQKVTTGPNARKPRAIDTKLSPQLVAAYDCWQHQVDKAKATAACKLAGSNLLVRVVITGDPTTALQQLRAAGFEPVPDQPGAKQLVGHIAIEKFAAIAEMGFVKFVTAQRNITAAKK